MSTTDPAAERVIVVDRDNAAVGVAPRARMRAERLTHRATFIFVLSSRGEVLVREALARKFAGIRFEVVPYRRDPAPIRIEHMGGAAAVEGGKQR